MPLWLNEGLADLYSSVAKREGHVSLGRAPFGRLYTLENQPLINLETLLEVGRESPYYSQSQKMLLFYAESWALTHMLALSPDYAAEFPKFVEAVSAGANGRDSLAKIYGKTLDQVTADLQHYLSRKQLPTHVFELDMTAAEVEAKPLASPRQQVDLRWPTWPLPIRTPKLPACRNSIPCPIVIRKVRKPKNRSATLPCAATAWMKRACIFKKR